MAVKKIAAGYYEFSPTRRIARSEWDGPKGGRTYTWEVLTPDPYAEWVGGNGLPFSRLRDAVAYLEREGTGHGGIA